MILNSLEFELLVNK